MNKEISRREFIKFATLGALAAACTKIESQETSIPALPTPLETGTSEAVILPTVTALDFLPKIELSPTPTIEQKFMLGSFDTATTPFTAQYSDELNSLLGHVSWSNPVRNADKPMPITAPSFGTGTQFEIFEEAIDDRSKGNPYYVITTSEPNHIITYFHSITRTSVGETAREIDAFIMHNPEKITDIIGQEVTFKTKEGLSFAGSIVNVMTVTRDFFRNLKKGTPWGRYPEQGNILFARTERFGFPDSIRQDRTPGAYYITIVSCISDDGKISGSPTKNIKNRALVTFKVQIPQ